MDWEAHILAKFGMANAILHRSSDQLRKVTGRNSLVIVLLVGYVLPWIVMIGGIFLLAESGWIAG